MINSARVTAVLGGEPVISAGAGTQIYPEPLDRLYIAATQSHDLNSKP
jgi:hypothetical protein